MLYDYLVETYGENEPIFVAEIEFRDMSKNSIRQQIKKLADAELLKRYDTGIYFIPKKSIFKSGSQLSLSQVIEKKYLKEKENCCGYIGGLALANQLGLTTQVPMVCEVVTNKATNDYRETMLANSKVVIRKPRTVVNEQNYRILQFLDMIKEIDFYAEISGDELTARLLAYMRKCAIKFSDIEEYLPYYPEKIYKNLYEVGLLNGISA